MNNRFCNLQNTITDSFSYEIVSEGRTNQRAAVFCCLDLDLGLMTLKLERGIDILRTYPHTENEVARSSHLKI